MADSTIPGLVAVAVPAVTDLIGVRQSGDTRDKKLTVSQLLSLGMTADPILLSDGSVGAPSYSFASDPNTGVFLNGPDELSFAVGGIEGLRLAELNSGVIQVPNANVAVTAFAGGGQGSATQLDESFSVIGTVATTGDSVKLPPVFAINSIMFVKNDGANAADIFPATGDNLGAGVDTAVSIPAGSSMSFIATVSNSTWTQLVVDTFGAGDVTKVGTPVDNQVGVWTGDGTIEGTTGLTYDGSDLDVTGNITLTGTVDGIDIATDVAANTAKVTNATHTGQVTGSGALALDISAITDQPASGAIIAADTILINDGGVLSEATFTQMLAFFDANITITASQVSDFDTEVSNNASVAANTAKVTNATHTGQVTGSGALALDVTAITDQPASGAIDAADTILVNDGGVLSESTFTQLVTFFDANLSFGDVSKVGTPVDNQVGVWTGDGTIEGTTGLTYDGADLDVTGNITLTGTVDGIDIATDVAANTAKVTNATHTGQVTGATALALDVTAITDQPASGAIIAADTILINDGGVLSEATFTQMLTFFDANLSFVPESLLASDAAGPAIVDEAATGTNPTLIPNRVELDTGMGWAASDTLSLIVGGASIFTIGVNGILLANAAGPSLRNEAATATNPTVQPNKSDADTGLGWAAADQLSLVAGGTEGARVEATQFTMVNFVFDSNQTVGAGQDNFVLTYDDASGEISLEAVPIDFPEYLFIATDFSNPNNTDWEVNALAPAVVDSNDNALTIRAFDDTVQEGVGLQFKLPAGTTQMTLQVVGRAETAPGAAAVVKPAVEVHDIPNNAAVPGNPWTSLVLDDIDIPTNEFFQYDDLVATYSALSLTAGEYVQMEFIRDATHANDDLTGDWNVFSILVTFQ